MFKLSLILFSLFFLWSCGKYSKGDRFTASLDGDSVIYVVAAKGSGQKISDIAAKMKVQHESRGNTCTIRYVTDSASLNDIKALLLLNSTLPDIEEDFLSKGFFGQFSSKQIVSYMLVSYEDVNKYFRVKDKR